MIERHDRHPIVIEPEVFDVLLNKDKWAFTLAQQVARRPYVDPENRATHAPAYRDLSARIQATDWLIDQVVYKMYGLAEDEVAIVEGRG